MAKIIKKKFFEIEIPLINENYEAIANAIEELNNKVIKMDVTRQLKGKSVDLVFKIIVKDGKALAIPTKLTLLPFFIKHMIHTGVDYVEDSFKAETNESNVIIKPFLITRKKVSRAVRRTLRNSAKNWIMDYLKTKSDYEVFSEILSNQLQKLLSLRLKKVYPLAVCEIRIFELKNPLSPGAESKAKEVGKIELKEQIADDGQEIKEITENIEVKEELKEKKAKKSKKTEDKKEE